MLYGSYRHLSDGFKISCAVLAERTYEIVGEFSFMDVSAYLADISFFAFGLRLRLDVVLIIRISHRFSV